MCYNINNLAFYFDRFVEQCLTPLADKFDIIGLCETKLTNDFLHL